jgi:DNA-binding NarL/FixJ family response regulator
MTQRSSHPPARILIVDDEPLNVDYLEQELDDLGFDTDTAATGLEALERIAASPPDLVLLDVMMPGMDGISVVRILKDDPDTRLIPVVLMTALNSVDDRVRGIEAGADDFLSKPVDERELLARIRTALNLKRAIDRTLSELAITSAHLERYGRQNREVAVLAVDWRPRATGLPLAAVSFVGRRHREAAEERIRALGGTPGESDGSPLVAVFEGPDERSRAVAAVEAGLAVLAARPPATEAALVTSLAISVGTAEVGSTRVTRAGEARWVYAVEGGAVEVASALARAAGDDGVLVAGAAAAAVSARFRLAPLRDGTYRVLEPTGDKTSLQALPPAPERRIASFLVTDIVGSTRIAERVGDQAWTELLATHERATRDQLVVFGGDEIGTIGDGVLASFDAPARAIRCALALMAGRDALGLRIRAGVHTGEVENLNGVLHGIALNIAGRVAARANPGEVLVSATTRDLAAGSGLVFTARGEHVLEGLPEPRRLYAAVAAQPRGPAQGAEAIAATEPPARLTPRELDVLRLVAAGLSDAETAAQLFLSVRTVNAHLRSVYRKAGVRSRTAAARFADENGLL